MGVNVVNGGSMSSIRTAVNTAEIQLSLRGRTVLKGPGDGQAPLLVPQDGVLVVELQMLHRCSTSVFSATVPVFYHLEGFLHFSVPENTDTIRLNSSHALASSPRVSNLTELTCASPCVWRWLTETGIVRH